MLLFPPVLFLLENKYIHSVPCGCQDKSLVSKNMKRISGVEISMLNNIFSDVRSSVIVLTYPAYLIKFPPIVIQVRYGLSFWGS